MNIYLDINVLRTDNLGQIDDTIATELMLKVLNAIEKKEAIHFILYNPKPANTTLLLQYETLQTGYRDNPEPIDLRKSTMLSLQQELASWLKNSADHLLKVKQHNSFHVSYEQLIDFINHMYFQVSYFQPELFTEEATEQTAYEFFSRNQKTMHYENIIAHKHHIDGLLSIYDQDKKKQYQDLKIATLEDTHKLSQLDPELYWHQKTLLICESHLRWYLSRGRDRLNREEISQAEHLSTVYLTLSQALPEIDTELEAEIKNKFPAAKINLTIEPDFVFEQYKRALRGYAYLFIEECIDNPKKQTANKLATLLWPRFARLFGLPQNMLAFQQLTQEVLVLTKLESRSVAMNAELYNFVKQQCNNSIYNRQNIKKKYLAFAEATRDCQQLLDVIHNQDSKGKANQHSFGYYNFLSNNSEEAEKINSQYKELIGALTVKEANSSRHKNLPREVELEDRSTSLLSSQDSFDTTNFASAVQLFEAGINKLLDHFSHLASKNIEASKDQIQKDFRQLQAELSKEHSKNTTKQFLLERIMSRLTRELGFDALLNTGLAKIKTAISTLLSNKGFTPRAEIDEGPTTNLPLFFEKAKDYFRNPLASTQTKSGLLSKLFHKSAPTSNLIIAQDKSVNSDIAARIKKLPDTTLLLFDITNMYQSCQKLHDALQLDGTWRRIRDAWWNNWLKVSFGCSLYAVTSLSLNLAALNDNDESDALNQAAEVFGVGKMLGVIGFIQGLYLIELIERKSHALAKTINAINRTYHTCTGQSEEYQKIPENDTYSSHSV